MAGSDDLMLGLHELHEARPGYDRAAEYWRAEAPEHFDSPVWRRALARSAGKFRLNIAKIPVVAVADRLKVAALTAVTEDGARDEEADQVLQDQVWRANKLQLQTKRLIRNALALGDAYWFIWPAEAEGTVRIHYNSPMTTRVVYDPDDDLRIMFAIRRFCKHGKTMASLLYPDRLELGWVLEKADDELNPKSWQRDPEGKDVKHNYGRPPVFHFRTDLPYGTPESEDAWGAQDAMNKLTATIAHTAERAGLADRYVLTDPQAALNGDGILNMDWDDDGDASEDNRDNSLVRTGPGEMAVLSGVKGVGEWSAPQPAGFMDPADWFAANMAKVTRTPGRYADPSGQHPSGAALRAADAPLDAKTEDRQDFFTDELSAAGAFALQVCGLTDRRVAVRWKPAGIVDDLDTWAIVAAKVEAGVPQRVALLETGLYEQDVVDAWLKDSQVEMDVARRISLLTEFTSSVQQLSQGVALGLVPDDAARRIVEQTIAQLAPDVATDQPA